MLQPCPIKIISEGIRNLKTVISLNIKEKQNQVI